jgi:hypothetical protein
MSVARNGSASRSSTRAAACKVSAALPALFVWHLRTESAWRNVGHPASMIACRSQGKHGGCSAGWARAGGLYDAMDACATMTISARPCSTTVLHTLHTAPRLSRVYCTVLLYCTVMYCRRCATSVLLVRRRTLPLTVSAVLHLLMMAVRCWPTTWVRNLPVVPCAHPPPKSLGFWAFCNYAILQRLASSVCRTKVVTWCSLQYYRQGGRQPRSAVPFALLLH